jgi:hypothetical protein
MRYARSDVLKDGDRHVDHGRGHVHERPLDDDGKPVHPWGEDCLECDAYFANSPMWASTIAEIPETPDEVREREQREKHASAEQEKALGNLPGNLAGALGPALAAALAPLFAGVLPGALDVVRCGSGHPNAVNVKFCGECGSPMGSVLAGAVVPDTPAPDGAQHARQAPTGAEIDRYGARAQKPRTAARTASKRKPLKDMRLADLQAQARSQGLAAGGNRNELIARIRAAKTAA